MHRPIAKFASALAVALTVAQAIPAPAAGAEDISPPPPEVELLELDEVQVHGERLITRIIDAEDEFYKLYNQLNKDDRYDVHCPYLNVSPDSGSRINSRVCLPGFVATAIADFAQYQARCEPRFSTFDANRDGRISRTEAYASADLSFQFDALDQNDDDLLDEFGEFKAFENWALVNMNCYRPPPPDLVLTEGSKDWYEHMLQVTNSDPRLREMAGRLDDMHRELVLVQRRYREVTAQAHAQAVDRTPDMRHTGPRQH